MVKNLTPKTYLEALELLNKGEFRLLAGGTDLMVQHRGWSNTLPTFNKDVLLIFNLQELKYVKVSNGFIHIGANMSLEDIKDNKLIPKLLVDAINIMASPAIRNMATIGGNIGNASPAGDTLPALHVMNAIVVLESVEGVREIALYKFITGPGKTVLNKNELIKEIKIPTTEFSKVQFEKVGGRKADAISKISFAGACKIDNNIVTDFRVAFGAVGPTVVRIRDLEKTIVGLSIENLKKRAKDVRKDYESHIRPIDDQRSNKEYRKEVALNLLEDFILNI